MKYYITGISRLTGDRDKLTPPITLELAQDLIEQELTRRRRARRGGAAYTHLRIVEAVPEQLKLSFT